VLIVAALVFASVVLLTYAGYVAPWSGRFYSLWDTGYAKIHIPIITSVSEHQPTTWTSFFFDLHVLVCIFPAGVWFCIKEINDERVFSEFSLYFFDFLDQLLRFIDFYFSFRSVILYAIFASYFAGVMVRLILTLTPVVCVLSAIAISK
jgi:dolichyl-diphosphooligosaccharide--protein glycosyltransferase